METFIENIKSALSSIRDNKGRSFLTMLGIIIGIGSVIMILSLGSGMTQYVNGQFDEIGGGTITVSIDTSKTIKTFSSNDCYEIKEQVEGIKGITPVGNSFDATITASKGNYDCLITYGNEDLKLSQKTEIIKGRYFNKDEAEDGSNVCIISESNAKKLFGNTNVIGLTLEMSMWGITNEVQIIGIRKDTQLDEIYAQLGIGDIIMMDVPGMYIANVFNYGYDEYTSLTVLPETDVPESFKKSLKNYIESMLDVRGESAVSISSSGDNTESFSSIMNIITLVVALVAAISLIVGGIGVMNIMTVTVTERTREIGIRKALGARTSYIMVQFLAESAIICLIGGFIGTVVGISAAHIVGSIIELEPVVSPLYVIGVVAISSGIGIFFGMYPAKRAAALDPIEALRQE